MIKNNITLDGSLGENVWSTSLFIEPDSMSLIENEVFVSQICAYYDIEL